MNYIDKVLEEFENKFRCITPGCDSNGTIGVIGDNGDVEAEQCQFCDQILLPIKAFFKQSILALQEQHREALDKDRNRIWGYLYEYFDGSLEKNEIKFLGDVIFNRANYK